MTTSVSEFISLTTEIDSFNGSLNDVSGYLGKYNPPKKLVEFIDTFKTDPYVQHVKLNIRQLVDKIDNQDVKTKYQEITEHLYSLSRPYNQLLKSEFESFKKKIGENKASLKQNINKYIQKIRQDLTEHSSCVQELIKLICENVNIFNTNYSKIGQSSVYLKLPKLMKLSGTGSENSRITANEISKINQILLKLVDYRNDFHTFDRHKKRFLPIMRLLKFYSQTVSNNQNLEYKTSKTGSSIIDPVLNPLEKLKFHLAQFDKHLSYVNELEEIGKHISTMKSELGQVKDKVLPEAARYIDGLDNITIKQSDVQSSIKTIKNMNNNIIGRLKIARHTIEFYNKLQEEIKKFNGVSFNDCDFTQYLTVKQKLISFETNIKNAICKIKGEINKIKVENHTFVVQGDTYDESYYKKLRSPVETLIDTTLKEIDQIKDLVNLMQNKKNRSETSLSSIKCKVCGIKELKVATTKLTQIREELDKFVILQTRTKSLIELFKDYPKFGSIAKYSNELQNIISHSKRVIAYVNYYSDYLRTIGYVDNLINCMICYNPWFQAIKEIINKFNPNVKQVSFRLGIINYNLCLIKTLSCGTSVENNLWRLKDYMMNLKVYLDNVKTDLTNLKVILNKIRKDIYKICSYKCVLERLEKIVGEYIKWFERWTSNKLMVNYMESIKDKIKEILIVMKYIKDFHSHPKCINEIEGKLKDVESSVSGLECEIEGLTRNFLFESGMRMNTTSRQSIGPHGHKVV